jgi:hypothetical protein
MGWGVRSLILMLLLGLVTWRVLAPALSEARFGIAVTGERGGWSSDFAAHLTFARAVWRGQAGYDVGSHLRITTKWVGRPVEHALPFAYSPTMLWILGPFCALPAAWAYVLWTLLGVAATGWMLREQRDIWLAAVFFSPIAFSCFKLGQTGIFTTAGLLFCILRDSDTNPRIPGQHPKSTGDWVDAGVLWALTAKPPLALTGGVALLGNKRWRPVALACGLSVLSTALVTPLLGLNWMHEYAHLLTHYDLDTADPAYVWSLVPETMGNLRALLHVTLGVADSAASRWSEWLWLIALVAIASGVLRNRPVGAAWAFAVLGYLLLCPHVTSTEELHLALVMVLLIHAPSSPSAVARWMAVILTLAVLYLPPGLACQGSLRIPAVFTSKLLLAALVWARYVRLLKTRRQLPDHEVVGCA